MAKGLGTDPSRSLTQHVLVLALRDLLATLRSERRPIPCFVQDPTYTAEDQQLLAEAGVAVAGMESCLIAVAHAVQEVADRGAPIEVTSSAQALQRVSAQLHELLPRLQHA